MPSRTQEELRAAGVTGYFSDEAKVQVERIARLVAREELASLSGLMLRRLQDMGPTRSPERNMAVEILEQLFGEALRDFGATPDEPGQ